MPEKKYTTKPEVARVMQWDGTPAGAVEIVSWVCTAVPALRAVPTTAKLSIFGYNRGSSGNSIEMGSIEFTDPAGLKVIPNDYVVLGSDNRFKSYPPDVFVELFDERVVTESVPEVPNTPSKKV